MATYLYPTNYELSQIEPDLTARAMEGRLGLELMPARDVNAGEVRWTQQDNFFGLQHLRGLDGAPTRVQRLGNKSYVYEPGHFGEYVSITETELERRAGYSGAGTPVDVSDLVIEADNLLINREMDRMEDTIWSLLTTGTFSIKLDGPDGTQVGFTDSFPIQTYTAGIPWLTYGSATPIVNFQAVQQLGMAAGHSVDLGAGARAIMNSVTSNRLLNNQNAADYNGRRVSSGSTINSVTDFNQYLAAQNLPQIKVYDGGIQTSRTINGVAGPYRKFIPDGKVVVVGRRSSGSKIGEYVKTRNASNDLRPGSYAYTKDYASGVNAEKRTPATIERHRGHNGGPVIYLPSSVVVMNV